MSKDASIWDMAEFFFVRRYRRRGVGTRAAHDISRQFPGRWEVRVMQRNRSAVSFWEGAVATFAVEAFGSTIVSAKGKLSRVFSFDSNAT